MQTRSSAIGPIATNPQMWAYMLDRVSGEDTTADWFFRWTFAERVWGSGFCADSFKEGRRLLDAVSKHG